MVQLTDAEYVGLSIYLGFKSSYRREEMAYRGVDYDAVVAKLTERGLIKNGRIQKKEARAVFAERFPTTAASQTHQVLGILGLGHKVGE